MILKFKDLPFDKQLQFLNNSNALFFRTIFFGEVVNTNSGLWKLWSLKGSDYNYNVLARFRVDKEGNRTQELLVKDVLYPVSELKPLLWGIDSGEAKVFETPSDVSTYQEAYKMSISKLLIEYHKAEGFYDD